MEFEPKVKLTIEGNTLSAVIEVSVPMEVVIEKAKNGAIFNGNSAEKFKRKVDIQLDELLQNVIEVSNQVNK